MNFQLRVRVYQEDTDSGGIMFHAGYLRFFDRARTEWLRSLGFEQRSLHETQGGLLVVSQASLRYLRPARLDDELLVTAAVEAAGQASVTMGQQALRAADGALLCTARVRIAWVDAVRLRPAKFPPELLDAISQ